MRPIDRPTPRTLADCEFAVGYQEVEMQQRNRSADILLAGTIGVIIAIALVSWWAS